MKMIILYIYYLIFVKGYLPDQRLRQSCKLTTPDKADDCNSVTEILLDKNYKCCYETFYFHSQKVKLCNYLQYKMKDLLRAEINNLEQLYNAKSVDIDCFGYFLKNKIINIILILIFYII